MADLISALLLEQPERYAGVGIPSGVEDRRRLLRGLMNMRPPLPASDAFLRMQDAYLQQETANKGITDASDIADVAPGIALWRGDITTLRTDAIVNAANSAMLGCFCPNHGCIDNAIHTFAGVQLRLYMHALMLEQGHDEPTGTAKLSPGYNLPCRHVLHTVGPIVHDRVTALEEAQLASCYNACMDLAHKSGVRSVAFCCISTGEFRFPNALAAQIAVQTVRAHKAVASKQIRVLFNVFTQKDEQIYHQILQNV